MEKIRRKRVTATENGVYYLLFGQTLSWDCVRAYLPLVSEQRQQRLARFAVERDKVASLLAQLLARYVLTQTLKIENAQIRFARDLRGKPYLESFADVRFSVSHTDGCVAFAIGTQRLGVDAERRRPANLRIAERFFTARETERIHTSADRQAAFYEVWTKKEAYLKMRGTGLTESLRDFDVFDEWPRIRFETRMLSEHTLSCCRESDSQTDETIDFGEIGFDRLQKALDEMLRD